MVHVGPKTENSASPNYRYCSVHPTMIHPRPASLLRRIHFNSAVTDGMLPSALC